MEMESGKLFIGGISWDTDEERLREYFQTFGEVVEAVIMKDRATGRARGFGFIVFADPAVAERVVREKHVIDGRTVEAKKAVPREDQHVPSRNNSSIQGSPGPSRTKKIFVGGLPSTVTESDFKKYFDQFGIITDVVVMYDHNTQRPRGFGFITYDSEEAVDKVLFKTFHELNGKLVEVKRAVPKEISPGPTRSQLSGYNYGLSRVSSFLNAYTQGYNPNPMGGYGVQIDGRYSPVTVGRSGYASFSPSNYGVGLNFEQGLSSNYAGTGSFGSDLDYGRAVNPLYNGGSNRYGINVANRYGINVGHGMGSGGSGSVLSSTGRSMWGGNPSTNSTSNDLLGSGGGNSGLFGAFGNSGTIWGASSNSGQNGGNNSALSSGNFNYGRAETSFDPSVGGPRRNSGSGVAPKLSNATTEGNDGFFGNFHGGGSIYRDSSWQSSSPDPEGPGSFGYGLGNAARDISPKDSVGYVGGYGVASRSNRAD